MLQTSNNIYLIYEFCNGGTLEEKVFSKGKLTQAEVQGYFVQMLLGLEQVVK